MEADSLLKMVEYEFRYFCFIIDAIVSSKNSTVQAMIKHPSICVQGQVLKSSKGKLDNEIPVPSLLEDPSHNVKVVANHIFYIVNYVNTQRCGYNKADAIRLNKYWGYVIKKNRKNLLELQQASKVPL